jgi:putative hydrolase of the HAD superfamily
MIKAICFDFDGTLAHFTGDFFAHMKESAVQLGIPEPLHEEFIATYLQYDRSHATFSEALQATFTSLQRDLPEGFETSCQDAIKRYASRVELLSGAKGLLELLTEKNISLAVITNGPKDVQAAAIHKVGIQNYFKTIIISGELGVRKPDARIFQLACERLDVQPRNCLMVGDNLDADIEGAKTTGMQVAWMSQNINKEMMSFGNLQALEAWLLNPDSTVSLLN